MEKLELIKKDENIYRVLNIEDTKLLVIDCMHRTMPFYINKDALICFETATENDLPKKLIPFDELTNKEKEKAQRLFSSIVPIIPFVGDHVFKNELIERCSNSFNVSKQTIRKRLCDYLCYQSLSVYISRRNKKPLTDDEKIIKKALNRFFYNSSKISLRGTYIAMLREYYMNEEGTLIKHPSFSKFKRFYYSNRKESNYLISRYGRSKFDRDFRPTLSNGVAEYYKELGYCELDSTLADIWLVNEKNQVVGRPVITIAVDPVTTLCMGVYVGYEETSETIKQLFLNIIEDKTTFCKKNSILIEEWQWPNKNVLPRTIICDRGKPFISNATQNLVEIGVTFINLAPFHASDKGTVEHYFYMLQSLYKEELINCGVIRNDISPREQIDYRKNARITLNEFRRIVIRCILYLNNSRIINLPYKYIGKVQPTASKYYMFKLQNERDFSIEISKDKLCLLMLPRTVGYFGRKGLVVNGIRYRKYGYLNESLAGKKVDVAYDRLDVSKVYLIDENHNYVQFELIDEYFKNMTLDETNIIQKKKRKFLNSFKEDNLIARTILSKEVLEHSHKSIKCHSIKKHKKTKKNEISKLRRIENNG